MTGRSAVQVLSIEVPKNVNVHRRILLAIRVPSMEDNPDALVDIQIYEKSAGEADLEDVEFVGGVLCICQDGNDPDNRLYIRAYKDCTGFVDEEVFLHTPEGYPLVLAGDSNERYTSELLDADVHDVLPDPLS